MKTLSLATIALAIVLLISWLSIAFGPSSQNFMWANPFWNGSQDFNRNYGVQRLADLKQAKPRPEGSVLIAAPYLPYNDEELKLIAGFVEGGGTLLLMDDYGYGNQVLKALGLEMEFAGLPLLDPYITYRNRWLPIVTDLAPELREAGVERLVLNHATALVASGPYEVLARSSDTAFLDENSNESWDAGEPKGHLAVAVKAALGGGTVIAVSDPSIITNSMLGRGDNDVFMKVLIAQAGENPSIALDGSHLPKSLLDRSKEAWEVAQKRMSSPHSQVLLVGAILAVIMMPIWRKGADIEQK